MKLTRHQFTLLFLALKDLERAEDTRYKFGAKVRYALAKNLRILGALVDDFNKFQSELVAELAPVTRSIAKGTPERQAYDTRYEAFLTEVEEVSNLISVKFEDLNLEVNQIPVNVLSDLLVLVREE